MAAGSSVTLTATPGAGYYFSGWSGGPCSGSDVTCVISTITANATVDAKFTQANIIFATAASYTLAQLQALDPQATNDVVRGADQLCANRAAVGTATASFSGRTWTSLLVHGASTSSLAYPPKLGTKRGWVRPDSKPFTDTVSALANSYLVYYPPDVDENGATITDGYGKPAAVGSGCTDWTSTTATFGAGVPSAGGVGWSSQFGMPCTSAMRIYCASTDFTAAIPAPGIPVVGAWTGAANPQAVGTAATTCSDWTAATGSTGYSGGAIFSDVHLMYNFFAPDCATAQHLSCFQQ